MCSINHRIFREARPERSIPEWKAEMVGMREALERFSYVDSSKVVGIRAPRLAMGGDNQLKMMSSNKFAYDNSLFVEGGPFWPQTLDYKTPWTCPSGQHCPQEKYPALWQFPINEIIRNDGKRVSMLRSALKVYETPFSLSQTILNNFNRSMSANRAPFILNLDADYLNSLPQGGAVNALETFLETDMHK
uniref:Uncharacterized protein n=1 Tax=Panagrolaimus davidi TaxID=227884 RepID=A0A914PGS1_9BILA